ncbi:MAG: sigma-70 family RNA polymerase sigma factor [Gemmataceae bacterium]
MPRRPFDLVLQHLRLTTRPEPGQLATDADLLARFVASRDEQAFAELLRRHGSMVLGVARSVLGDAHEAEDVYQAAFLVLARNAPYIRKHESVGSWLYGVALRIALKARRRNQTRRQREHASAVPDRDEANMNVERQEIRQELVKEIERLPRKYRDPVVLCYIEGRTHEEAAQHLRWPVGTIKWRLGQARERLRKKLEGKQLAGTAGAGLVAAMMAQSDVRAAVAPTLERKTLQAALNFAAGESAAGPAHALAESALRDLLHARLLKRFALGSVALCLLTGAGFVGWQALTDGEPSEIAEQAERGPGKERPQPRSWRASGAQTARFEHGGDIADVALAPDGRFLVSNGGNGLCLWDIAKASKIKELSARGNFAAVNRSFNVTVSPDSRLVAVAGLNPAAVGGGSATGVTLIDAASGNFQVLPGAGNVDQLRFSADSTKLLTSALGQLVLWDVNTRKPLIRLEQSPPAGGGPVVVTSVALSADGKTAYAATTTGLLRWDVATGRSLPAPDISGTPYLTRVTTFSADGRFFAWATDKQIHVVDLSTGKQVASVAAERVIRLALAPDGRQLAYVAFSLKDPRNPTARGKDDDVVHVLALPGGEEITRCRGHEGYVYGLSFRADGNVLATGSTDRSVRLWDLKPLPTSP